MWVSLIIEEETKENKETSASPKYYVSVYKKPPEKFKYIRIVHMDDYEELCCRV